MDMYVATYFEDKKMRMNMMDPSNGPYYIRTKEMQTTDKMNEKWAPRYILYNKRKQKNSIILVGVCLYNYQIPSVWKERTIRSNNSKNENKLNTKH